MRTFLRKSMAAAVGLMAWGMPAVRAGAAPEPTEEYVLTFARICLATSDAVQADDKANVVLETYVFHDDASPEGAVTGTCVLEYSWSPPPGRMSSKALDRLTLQSSIAVRKSDGVWTARPETVDFHLYFFKAGETSAPAAAREGKWRDVSPSTIFSRAKILSFLPDQSAQIEELVTDRNQSAQLPWKRSWTGQAMTFKAEEYPQAVLIVNLKGLHVDGYACYIYEYDPQGAKTPVVP